MNLQVWTKTFRSVFTKEFHTKRRYVDLETGWVYRQVGNYSDGTSRYFRSYAFPTVRHIQTNGYFPPGMQYPEGV